MDNNPPNNDGGSESNPPHKSKTFSEGDASKLDTHGNMTSNRPNLDPRLPLITEPSGSGVGIKKKRHRAGKKKQRNRRQSFNPAAEDAIQEDINEDEVDRRPSLLDGPRPSAAHSNFYRLGTDAHSNTSLDSEALLDHRSADRRRRSNSNSLYAPTRPDMSFNSTSGRMSHSTLRPSPSKPEKSRTRQHLSQSISEDDEEDADDRTPLIGSAKRDKPTVSRSNSGYGGFGGHHSEHRRRRPSAASKDSKKIYPTNSIDEEEDFDVNNPPSVPGSPKMGSLDDVMIPEDFGHARSPPGRDTIIDIDRDESTGSGRSRRRSSDDLGRRRRTLAVAAENDVCYPGDAGMSEIGEEESVQQGETMRRSPRRRRRRQWPDLDVLDEWSRDEKEERATEHVRAKKITEPVMVGGRLRPSKTFWHREESDAPYRYTYFNESFDATIHSRTISELCQFGANYKDLFNPEAPELSESDDDEEEDGFPAPAHAATAPEQGRGRSQVLSLQDESRKPSSNSGSVTPAQSQSQPVTPRTAAKRYGPRPTFWLDVLRPTEIEMKVLAKAFGIHQLTTEDIMMQEPREKVELFQNYYFVNYRSFEQDKDSEDYMEPVNIYVVVFRDGVLSFHFSMTPHMANVRRRIRQLNDYMSPSADWISYAIIDDVTDAYAPLVQTIEDEVDDIDDKILALHSSQEDEKSKKQNKNSDAKSEKGEKGEPLSGDAGGDMLRHVGECRKKVMSLYRLLGNKADVIKGFAKRCNEHWDVAPRSEIGLYLGDIQDHIVTMTGNLSHYENLLSRAHSNYLAQINIRMNERAEQTNDVLGKLTVLGTIVLPMNIVTGMWGMNCLVPGQDGDDLTWFWGITAGLFAFGLACYLTARRVYKIV